MRIEEFIKLLILQKDYHQSKKDPQHEFAKLFSQFLIKEKVNVDEVIAPKLFADQPNIPFIQFTPVIPVGERRPLIMHTHGGPHVRFCKNTPHAEIMYFLELGYVVVCPNYRNSTDHPKHDPDYEIFERYVHTNEFTHIHGPEDVYAVAVHMQKQTYISPHRITLRGGSIGSKINAHLLAGIKTTKFASIFNGVHLVGGQGYPAPESLPTHIPILLAHAVKDEMAPYEQASTFMQALKPLGFSSLLIFVSQFGDHHMINSALTLKDVVSPQYDEFLGYVNMLADFMQRIDYGLLQPIYTAKAALPVHFKRNQYSAALLNKSRLLR